MKSIIFILTLIITILIYNNKMLSDNVDKLNKDLSDYKKVTGVGGIFFKSKDPAKLKEWYRKNLGLAVNEYGTMFETRSTDNPSQKKYLQWSLFPEKTKYFLPSEKDFMINYTVGNLDELVKELKLNEVNILDTVESYDYGKFVHIMDTEGNKIELWEPVDSTSAKEFEGETTH